MTKPKELKKMSLGKREDLCVRGIITEEEFSKQIRSKYNKNDAEKIIAGVQQRIKDKKNPEDIEDIPVKTVRTIPHSNSWT